MICYKFETKLFFDEGFAQIRSRLSELLLDTAILNELRSKKISHPEPASIQLLLFMRHFEFSFSLTRARARPSEKAKPLETEKR
jgi:hypothetical protein